MAITRVSIGAVTAAFNAAMTPVAGSYAIGDCLVAVYARLMGTSTITTPAGWTDIGDVTNCPQTRVFAKIAASATEAIPSIQFGTDFQWSYVNAYRGVDSSLAAAFSAAGRQANTTQNLTGPTVSRTPTADGSLVMFIANHNKTATSNGATFTPPTNFSLGIGYAPAGARPSGVFCEWIQTTASVIPASSFAASSIADTSATCQAMVIGLLPAVSPPPAYTADPTVSTLGTTSASFGQTLDSNSTAYAVAVAQGSTAPTATQIKAGQNGSGSAAISATSASATAAAALTLTLTGLTSSTSYDFYFVANNGNGDSSVKSVLNQTTQSVSTISASFSSATTDGYVIAYTPGATGTVYLIALLKGSATPTAALVRTGTPTGFVARFTKAATNGSASTIPATGLTLPKYDLYIILNSTGGDSPVTQFLNQQKLPAAGRQYVSFGTLSTSSPFSFVTPPLAAGDVLDIVATTDSGYAVTVTSAGDLVIDAGGDESRELAAFNVYDDSLQAMYYTGDSVLVVNDALPTPNTDPGNAFTIFLAKNTAASVDISTPPLFTDADDTNIGLAEVGNVLSTVGLSLSGTLITGTTVNIDTLVNPVIVGTDQYLGSSSVIGTIVIGRVAVPNVDGFDIGPAMEAVARVFLTASLVLITDSSPAGTVVSYGPPPGTLLDPGSAVSFFVSQGPDPIQYQQTAVAGGNSTKGMTPEERAAEQAEEAALMATIRDLYRAKVLGTPSPDDPPPVLPVIQPSKATPKINTKTGQALIAALMGKGDDAVKALNKIGT
jgi:hypothetical protein